MNEGITIGVDLAKKVFQVHGVEASGETVIRRQTKVAAVALANKMARMTWALLRHGTWALLRHGGTYRKPATASAA